MTIRISLCAERRIELDIKVKEIFWIDNNEKFEFAQENKTVSAFPSRNDYGGDLVVMVAKIITK